MCPAAHDPPANLELNWNVEEIFKYLDSYKPGTRPPRGCFDDINPYQYRPSNLPVGIWYFVNLTEKKENAFGLWEVKEEASEVFANSSISGWRTTLQFLEYQESPKHATNWIMHEYKIIVKKLSSTNKEKESRAICRVLDPAPRSSETEKHDKSKGYTEVDMNVPSISPRADNNSKQVSTSGSLESRAVCRVLDPAPRSSETEKHDKSKGYTEVYMNVPSISPRADNNSKQVSTSGSLDKKGSDGGQLVSGAEKRLEFNGDFLELNDLADPPACVSDYLELLDLAVPMSCSSSSDILSTASFTSEEYFNPDTLLQELEDHTSRGQQAKDAGSKLTATSSVRPFEVVVQPASSGSLVSSTERNMPRTEGTMPRTEGRDNIAPASSNINPTVSNGKKKADSVKMKKLLKRKKVGCCYFMPFKWIWNMC